MQNRISPEIMNKAIAGDTSAFRFVVDEHQHFVYSVAFRFLQDEDDAEDITQEVFIRLWRNLKNYKREIKLTTWLYRIVANLCLDTLKTTQRKQRKSKVDLEHASYVHDATTPEKEMQDDELMQAIVTASEELTPKQKAVFILRDMEDQSVEEVCHVLGMSAGNVKSNLYYARQKIYEALQTYYQIRN